MKTCAGFVRARAEARAWKRCGRRPLGGDQLCASHRDAIDSALLGILEMDQRAMAEEGVAANSSPRVGHAKSCGGKSRRPSGSNRTRPERVPLPAGGEGLARVEGEGLEQTQRAGGESAATDREASGSTDHERFRKTRSEPDGEARRTV